MEEGRTEEGRTEEQYTKMIEDVRCNWRLLSCSRSAYHCSYRAQTRDLAYRLDCYTRVSTDFLSVIFTFYLFHFIKPIIYQRVFNLSYNLLYCLHGVHGQGASPGVGVWTFLPARPSSTPAPYDKLYFTKIKYYLLFEKTNLVCIRFSLCALNVWHICHTLQRGYRDLRRSPRLWLAQMSNGLVPWKFSANLTGLVVELFHGKTKT